MNDFYACLFGPIPIESAVDAISSPDRCCRRKGRTDDAFYAPLKGWKRSAGTTLYLGLLHHADEAGDKTRIGAAHRHIEDFGLSAECGWGRTEPGRLPGLLAGHRKAAEAL